MHADVPPHPASPWAGSSYAVRHRWQLDGVTTLAQAAAGLRDLAAELAEAHAAGWWLHEPVATVISSRSVPPVAKGRRGQSWFRVRERAGHGRVRPPPGRWFAVAPRDPGPAVRPRRVRAEPSRGRTGLLRV